MLTDHNLLDNIVRALARVRQLRVPPNTCTCNHILLRLVRAHHVRLVKRLFDLLLAPKVFTFNIVIDFLCKEGELMEATTMFEQMKET
jgi:pentatricopeptide repeat domain-containing protein 1